MYRDPHYYLQRANLYYEKAIANGLDELDDELVDKLADELDDGLVDELDDGLVEELDELVDELDDRSDDEYIYEYIPIKFPTETIETPQDTIIKPKIQIKPAFKRYFDPVTRHYYKTEKILENSSIDIIPNSKMVEKNADVWYPENKLNIKTIRDPKTGKYYRINKTYNDKGNFSYTYDKLSNVMKKLPGTNYYKPVYRATKK
jgi:hypothetical protein